LNLIRARSEGGFVSHVDRDPHHVVEISSDEEVTEMPARSSTRSTGLFVTPNPGERTTDTPDTRRRSTSAIQRRASSAPRAASSLHIAAFYNTIDLTQEDSDEEGENRDNEKQKDQGAKEETAADETSGLRAQLITGKKRDRRVRTSPPSEDGGDKKRLRPDDRRSLPLGEKQNWEFP
jgi:hypothetical protein